MPAHVDFEEVGRLPAAGDNVAIATQRLEVGTAVTYQQTSFTLDFTVLEGHRFAVRAIQPGEALLSWGLPFGVATRPILAGHYVHNADMLAALAGRTIDFALPTQPNFRNHIEPTILDEAHFKPGKQVPLYNETRTFMGYPRLGERGTGTRNVVIILGITSRTAGFAQVLAQRLGPLANEFAQVDGITAVTHTEGDGDDLLNNRDLVLRTLAGFIVHPNVGAALVIDYGEEQINQETLQLFMRENDYPLADVRHHFQRLTGHFEEDLAAGTAVIQRWLPEVNGELRTAVPLSELNIALQCGGSDAFSGVSGNPLAGSIAREIIRHGGKANLAETDELIGAEPYMLQNVRDVETARTFLDFIATFKERVAWHGASAEGNPSGGNRYRGLYNIALKSIGAAMKRSPNVRLDYAIDYAKRMRQPGFYFMNTPGNDLESIAGQVAGGANMIFFVTGNGSITNFPFVPTIKVVTTSRRFAMLAQEMDVNAGAYQDGRSLDKLTQEMLDLTVRVASGEKSQGEKSAHSQVSIWRNWRQTDRSQLPRLLASPTPSRQPIEIRDHDLLAGDYSFRAMHTATGYASQQVGLILPTSLCAGQIARMSAERLNQRGDLLQEGLSLGGLSQFVALVHTEGCGVAMNPQHSLYERTMISYMQHPMVRFGLFLEHGCEKTHNDFMRHELAARGLDAADFGWASVQLDGGIEAVMGKITEWFAARMQTAVPPRTDLVDLSQLRLGVMGLEAISPELAASVAQLLRTIVARGGTAVLPDVASCWQDAGFVAETIGAGKVIRPTLAYGQACTEVGLHIMAAPSRHWAETLTGLGATGVELILALGQTAHAGHPFVPLVRVGQTTTAELDLALSGDAGGWGKAMMGLITAVLNRQLIPQVVQQRHVYFQLTRGLLGVST